MLVGCLKSEVEGRSLRRSGFHFWCKMNGNLYRYCVRCHNLLYVLPTRRIANSLDNERKWKPDGLRVGPHPALCRVILFVFSHRLFSSVIN